MGVRGITHILAHLKMIESIHSKKKTPFKALITERTLWVRAKVSGILQPETDFNTSFSVKKGEVLAHIHELRAELKKHY